MDRRRIARHQRRDRRVHQLVLLQPRTVPECLRHDAQLEVAGAARPHLDVGLRQRRLDRAAEAIDDIVLRSDEFQRQA